MRAENLDDSQSGGRQRLRGAMVLPNAFFASVGNTVAALAHEVCREREIPAELAPGLSS